MALKKITVALMVLVLGFASACTTSYQAKSVQYNDYRITQQAPTQPALAALMKPYGDSVTRSMSSIVATAAVELEKKQPEGTLGNMLTDGMLIMASSHYRTKVDAAFINYGGIRLQSIPAGPISRGKIFELLPFDNTIVLQKLNGKVLFNFINHIAGKGGWPCAGITYQLQNKKAINIMVGGIPLNENATYTIANNDYVANGGDDCEMLRDIPQQNDGYVFRTAILEYLQGLTNKGQPITAKLEKRVSNAE